MNTEARYFVRTCIVIKSGAQALFDAFESAAVLKLSELIPEPAALSAVDNEAPLYFELLFGDEERAIEALSERGVEVEDAYEFGNRQEVRRAAMEYMKLTRQFGATTQEDWRRNNWASPEDLSVTCEDNQECLVLTIDGAQSLECVARALVSRHTDATYEVIVAEVTPASNARVPISSAQFGRLEALDSVVPVRLDGTTKFSA